MSGVCRMGKVGKTRMKQCTQHFVRPSFGIEVPREMLLSLASLCYGVCQFGRGIEGEEKCAKAIIPLLSCGTAEHKLVVAGG